MKNVLIALGLTLAATTGAFAQSSALDVQGSPELVRGNAAVNIPLSTWDGRNELTNSGPFQDESPRYATTNSGTIDYTATASIDDDGLRGPSIVRQPRLGDGGILPY
ncbi:MAG: hypothetical protein CML29_14260 [Rhizobiales bacterium]|nr:hypothetical protein [Hyphomicrobiales bacterium]MBA69238.1 hypothetical protein [Hyphomicrobiales bacterium]|tara:strand:- start:1911 stop:2231 length:321 start_codon:yes stop_codon:yes gene_type:complete